MEILCLFFCGDLSCNRSLEFVSLVQSSWTPRDETRNRKFCRNGNFWKGTCICKIFAKTKADALAGLYKKSTCFFSFVCNAKFVVICCGVTCKWVLFSYACTLKACDWISMSMLQNSVTFFGFLRVPSCCFLHASRLTAQYSVWNDCCRRHISNTNSYSTSSRSKQLFKIFCHTYEKNFVCRIYNSLDETAQFKKMSHF